MPRTVLVAVLDWGLGHATRCVPVIRELLRQNFRVIVGGSGPSLDFLKAEFQDLKFYELPTYGIVYPKSKSFASSLLFQLPKIIRRVGAEHKITSEIIEKEKVDLVISDNRYGCYSKRIKSIFICHQLNLQLPTRISFLSGLINGIHLMRVKKFAEVWVPDQPSGFRYSGELSNSTLRNVKYIGLLSRFGSHGATSSEAFEVVGLISGPENQRTEFENILRQQIKSLDKKSILVKGKPGSHDKIVNGKLTEVDHLDSSELEAVMKAASVIISRSGYSTLMDLAVLGKNSIFVPTPGQSEQEYLATYHQQNHYAVFQSQDCVKLADALLAIGSLKRFPKYEPNTLLNEAIQST